MGYSTKPRATVKTKFLNRSFSAAKASKQDEFYTQLSDIERELKHYKKHFKGKTVYCNCDDPRISNFFHYFSYNFEQLDLKKIVATKIRIVIYSVRMTLSRLSTLSTAGGTVRLPFQTPRISASSTSRGTVISEARKV
jgi:hypothetical protein